uniref:Ribonuclease III n=1 Tax=Pithovirus LCDPAC01 TaxID=2506600 RepID=A0A481YNZ7_9VIRU|nr:MAG: ribonuclease III [Pithovirus LCDPAC01]
MSGEEVRKILDNILSLDKQARVNKLDQWITQSEDYDLLWQEMFKDPKYESLKRPMLSTFIYRLLKKVLTGNDAIVDLYDNWIQVFTHESYSADSNYEYYEKIGDMVLKAVFTMYITNKFPEFKDPGELSLMDDTYMSTEFQSKLAEKLGLDKMVLLQRGIKLDKSIKEDLFEAFFGCLMKVSDKTYGMGAGYVISFNFFKTIMDEEKIDPNVKKDPITLLKERFDNLPETKKLNYTDKKWTTERNILMVRVTITFNGDFAAKAEGKAKDEKSVKSEAARKALIKANDSKEFSESVSKKFRREKDRFSNEMKEPRRLLMNILKEVFGKKKFNGISFKTVLTQKKVTEFLYVVFEQDGKIHETLIGKGFASSKNEAKLLALKNALQQYKQ